MEKLICIGLLIILVVIIAVRSNKEQYVNNILSSNARNIVNENLVDSCTFDPNKSENKYNSPFDCINDCNNNNLVNNCSTSDCVLQCEKCDNNDICLWKNRSCKDTIESKQCGFIPQGATIDDCIDNCKSSNDSDCDEYNCNEICKSCINPRLCPFSFTHITKPKKPSSPPNPPIIKVKPIYESLQVSILPSTSDNIYDIYEYVVVTRKLNTDICPTTIDSFSKDDILSEVQPFANNKLAIVNIKGRNGENLDVSSNYSVYVIAVNDKGSSSPSNIVCAKPSLSNINGSAEIGTVVNSLSNSSLQELLSSIEQGDRDAILSSLRVYKEKEQVVNKLSEEVQIFYDLLNNSNISLNIRA